MPILAKQIFFQDLVVLPFIGGTAFVVRVLAVYNYLNDFHGIILDLSDFIGG